MKTPLMILLLGATMAGAVEPQFVFENRPARGLPADAEVQQRSNRPGTNTTLHALLGDSVTMAQVRYFNLTWLDQKQVQEYLSGLLEDSAIPAGSHYAWSQGLGDPEIECYLTGQSYRQGKLLLWESVGAYQDPDGTWWFLYVFDYYHRAHPHGMESPAGRNAQFARQAVTNLILTVPQFAPISRTDRFVPLAEYNNSVTAYFSLTNGVGTRSPIPADMVVRVDSFANADQARLGLERSAMRPVNYTSKETFDGGELYLWSTNALAGRIGPYVLDISGKPATWPQMTNTFAALVRGLKSHTEDVGPTENQAVRVALNALNAAREDTSGHEMAEPESVQRLTLANGKAWRVSWRQKTSVGAPVAKGGQIVVIVYDSGRIEFGFGE